MKKKIVIIIALILVVSTVFAVLYNKDNTPVSPGTQTNNPGSTTPAIPITYDNLAGYMSRNAIVNDLPDDAKIVLKFYNFNSGERQWEKSFVITKSKVYEGSIDNPDLIIDLSSKYLAEWNNMNFCEIMTKANNNGDLGYESSISDISLAWKYKNLVKYKSCFGM